MAAFEPAVGVVIVTLAAEPHTLVQLPPSLHQWLVLMLVLVLMLMPQLIVVSQLLHMWRQCN